MYVPIPGSSAVFHLFCKYPILLLVLPIIAGLSVSTVPATERCKCIAMITFAFDDGTADTVNIAYPILAKHGYTGTAYITTDFIGTGNGYYMNVEQIKRLAAAGWEIGSHGATHNNIAFASAADISYELEHSKAVLEALGFSPQTFAAPFGEYTGETLTIVKQYYFGQRTAESTPVLNTIPIADNYQIHAWVVTRNTSVTEVEENIKKAMDEKKWLILVFHTFDRDGDYSYSSTHFEEIVRYAWQLHSQGIHLENAGGNANAFCLLNRRDDINTKH